MTADVAEIVRTLDADAIQRRMAEIDAERKALVPLLRAARARDRARRAPAAADRREVQR